MCCMNFLERVSKPLLFAGGGWPGDPVVLLAGSCATCPESKVLLFRADTLNGVEGCCKPGLGVASLAVGVCGAADGAVSSSTSISAPNPCFSLDCFKRSTSLHSNLSNSLLNCCNFSVYLKHWRHKNVSSRSGSKVDTISAPLFFVC